MDELNTVFSMIPNGNVSYASRLRGIRDAYDVLGSTEGLTEEQAGRMRDILDKEKGNTVAGMTLTGLTGALSLANQWDDSSRGADTSVYDARLAGMSQGRGQNFFNNTALVNAYNRQPAGFKANVDDLNKTWLQSAIGVGSSALTGAATGMQLAGPWGAVAGGVIGGVGGILADANARSTNQLNVDRVNHEQNYETQMNSLAMNTGSDKVHDVQFGNLYGTRRSMGGFLKTYTGGSSRFIHHSHCKGGTLVRIKAK